MRINRIARQISLKIVYFGPGMSGKTTNLVKLHAGYHADQRGELIKLDTETERTLFFDYFPADFGTIGGYRVKIDFFTVPGQSFYQATRNAVLEGVDGLVFVADSNPNREEANVVSKDDLVRALSLRGRDLSTIPHVYQWNKRDLPRALSLGVLERMLNPGRAPSIEAISANGVGVWETQSQIVKMVLMGLRSNRAAAADGAANV